MADGDSGIFRKKAMESIESPEDMHNYLRVTSPGIWIFLLAVILLLAGATVWSVFGRIHTTVPVAVVSQDGVCFCLVSFDKISDILDAETVVSEGTSLPLSGDITETIAITEDTDDRILTAGHFAPGDLVVGVSVDADLEPGVYEGFVTTEQLRAISLLMN